MASVKKPAKKKPRAKAGTSKWSASHKKSLFVNAYLSNGQNATQAAISAGYNPKSAAVYGCNLLKDINVIAEIDNALNKLSEIAGLSQERTLKEIARIAYADPRKLYDERGNLKPIHELDDDTAATIASIEAEERGGGDDPITTVRKLKQHSKTAALDQAMKFHGLYAKDNAQTKPDVAPMADMEIVRRIAFALAKADKEISNANG